MARTYYVKRAQQRYATKPVLNEDGTQKQTPKMRRGVQMKSKSGRPIFMKVTERDLSRPLPMPKCSKCGKTIEVGQPYKYTETYNRTIVRCGDCPVPQQWEYSSSLSARLAQIDHENDPSTATDRESLEQIRDDYAQAVRDLAEEKRESSQNLEEGFGHETEQSMELADIADNLESWADEIGGVEFEDYPELEDEDCPACGGEGSLDDEEECPDCDGTGQITPEEPTEDQLQEWLETAQAALEDATGNCPI